MSQFCGYTLQLELNDDKHTKLKGIISKIVDRSLIMSNAEYLDGSNIKEKELTIDADGIKDLMVIELPPKKKKDKKNKKEKEKTEKQSTPQIDSIPQGYDQFKIAQDPNQPYNYHSNAIDWQAEKAEKVKHLEEFDFESNLQKFDKASVFKELSEGDKIDPYNRLVGHNKLDEKTKYGNKEMVIQKKTDDWDNIDSKVASKSTAATPVSIEERSFSDNSATVLQRRNTIPVINNAVQLLDAGQPVATCSPLQLVEIENITTDKFAISQQILIENAGRGLAELIVKEIIGDFRVSNLNHNAPPLILLLAGNNRSGARVLAAGRHLFNHGIRVVTYLLHDFENSEDELLPAVSENLNILNKVGGKTVTVLSDLEELLSKINSPLEFILDGLQGFDSNLNDLIEPEVSNAKEIVTWCNNSNLPIMSVDVPSGLDASSGSADFESYLFSKYVVSVGLPLNSILNLYKFGYFNKHELTHFLVDCGIPQKVFSSKSSLRKFDKQWFTGKWNISLEII
ncbi:hypothetical protein CANARDRAFT_200868 [[Candida] arabinofermentans NRRL YB-2248]|uniref:Enhancer of mRNA-decapping protein 3 n=1 Tax=[Candida] arabinofermentans NRRL YB-2248 TaxID=983967 RepID=A0A1E4SY94_9ASCO|nr:hypothetical protein CANARDRAFT_200868 [[Candida] arabinofermentans NRRL YB-2248]